MFTIVMNRKVLLWPLSTGDACNFLLLFFSLFLLVFLHCVLSLYIQLYEFTLVVRNCMLTVTHKNQWRGAQRPKQSMAI